MISYGVIIISSLLCCVCVADTPRNSLSSDASNREHQTKLPPCHSCRTLVKSFTKGMDRTARGKHDGGDANWEEQKLKKYSNSEVRLTEIFEKICEEISTGKAQCEHLAEEHEELIEEWWKMGESAVDLFSFLCIDKMKVCCPNNYYGSECKPCPGDIQNPCNGHGRCRGNGTRKGSGECSCYEGYDGKLCADCKIGYYTDQNDPLTCDKCDASCRGHCRGPGPKSCERCEDGYRMTEEYGCGDIEECVESKSNPCKDDEFCANTYGSYICSKCHESCKGCTGDGPDFCIECSDDYILKDNICIKYDSWKRSTYVTFTRYMTYFGLCIATFIIFNRNTLVASIIGICVAVYIAISEYTVKDEMSSPFTILPMTSNGGNDDL